VRTAIAVLLCLIFALIAIALIYALLQ